MSRKNYASWNRISPKIIGRVFRVLILGALLFCPVLVEGEMTSTRYTIFADSIDTAGFYSASELGATSEDTLGELVSGVSSGGSYVIRAGYQYMDKGYLSVNVSNSNLSMGTLSKDAVTSLETVISVSTDSATGYGVYFGTISGNSIAAVSDGEVSIGSEEFGVAVSGVNSTITGDVAVSSNLLLDFQSVPTTMATTTLTFKASISATSVAGNYNQTIPLIVSSNVF